MSLVPHLPSWQRQVGYVGSIIALVSFAGFVGHEVGYTAGYHDGTTEAVDAFKNGPSQCFCGATRSCAFGPGIVGRMPCETTWHDDKDQNTWSRCEPDPRYREVPP